jgi:hypothetical protein
MCWSVCQFWLPVHRPPRSCGASWHGRCWACAGLSVNSGYLFTGLRGAAVPAGVGASGHVLGGRPRRNPQRAEGGGLLHQRRDGGLGAGAATPGGAHKPKYSRGKQTSARASRKSGCQPASQLLVGRSVSQSVRCKSKIELRYSSAGLPPGDCSKNSRRPGLLSRLRPSLSLGAGAAGGVGGVTRRRRRRRRCRAGRRRCRRSRASQRASTSTGLRGHSGDGPDGTRTGLGGHSGDGPDGVAGVAPGRVACAGEARRGRAVCLSCCLSVCLTRQRGPPHRRHGRQASPHTRQERHCRSCHSVILCIFLPSRTFCAFCISVGFVIFAFLCSFCPLAHGTFG